MLKKIFWIIPLMMLLSTTNVYAASFDLDLVVDKTSVSKGEELNIKLSNKNLAHRLASGEYQIDYDTNYYNFACTDVTYLQNVISAEVDCNVVNNQIIIIYTDDDGGNTPISSGEFLNLKFNVKKGATTPTQTIFTLSGDAFSTFDTKPAIEYIPNAEVSKTVSIVKSSDIYLKELKIQGYNIEFDKNKFEYSIEVENDVSKINITATTNASTSTVTGIGEKELVVGDNKITLTVTAENGSTKDYVINVNRKDINKITGTIDENPKSGINYSLPIIVFVLVAGSVTLYIVKKKNLFQKI